MEESKVVEELVNNINTHKATDNVVNIVHEKNMCKAAVRLNTYGSAYQYRLNNKEVYLVKEDVKGVYKTFAYIRCSKSSNDGCNFCHIHDRMNKLNSSGVKVFDKDVIPQNLSDKTRWLANLKDEYFDNMRKKKKKEETNSFVFPNETDPVLLILNNKKSKICSMLYTYATQLLKDIDIKEPLNPVSEVKKQIKKEVKKEKNIKYQLNEENVKKIPHILPKIHEDEIEDEIEDIKSIVSEEVISSSDEESEKIDEEPELEPDDEIYTNDGQQFYIKNTTVYKADGDDGCAEVGELIEIVQKHHTIKYNEKYYSIFHKDNHVRKGVIYICIISNKVFNAKMKHIGKAKKTGLNTYELVFPDEI